MDEMERSCIVVVWIGRESCWRGLVIWKEVKWFAEWVSMSLLCHLRCYCYIQMEDDSRTRGSWKHQSWVKSNQEKLLHETSVTVIHTASKNWPMTGIATTVGRNGAAVKWHRYISLDMLPRRIPQVIWHSYHDYSKCSYRYPHQYHSDQRLNHSFTFQTTWNTVAKQHHIHFLRSEFESKH